AAGAADVASDVVVVVAGLTLGVGVAEQQATGTVLVALDLVVGFAIVVEATAEAAAELVEGVVFAVGGRAHTLALVVDKRRFLMASFATLHIVLPVGDAAV
ncbi:hypothetical protein HZU77_017030, partial [Neisseriaceae bacterium TC5R-5]|nr:hypothetical protein [Neisseriaceae bacterium TC5R-5]